MNRQSLAQLVFLAGLSGSGKSTVAAEVAKMLNCGFVDIDEEIAEQTGLSIRNIFDTQGEESFRELEAARLVELVRKCGGGNSQQTIVALGGGALMSERNLALIKSSGVLICLTVSCEIAGERLQSQSDRPLTLDEEGQRLPQETLIARLETLMQSRMAGYSQADYVVDTSERSVKLVCQDVVRYVTDRDKA